MDEKGKKLSHGKFSDFTRYDLSYKTQHKIDINKNAREKLPASNYSSACFYSAFEAHENESCRFNVAKSFSFCINKSLVNKKAMFSPGWREGDKNQWFNANPPLRFTSFIIVLPPFLPCFAVGFLFERRINFCLWLFVGCWRVWQRSIATRNVYMTRTLSLTRLLTSCLPFRHLHFFPSCFTSRPKIVNDITSFVMLQYHIPKNYQSHSLCLRSLERLRQRCSLRVWNANHIQIFCCRYP